jgi:hypothetical protein
LFIRSFYCHRFLIVVFYSLIRIIFITKYLWSGKWIVRNSPVNAARSAARGAGALLTSVPIVGAGIAGLGVSLYTIDEIQHK